MAGSKYDRAVRPLWVPIFKGHQRVLVDFVFCHYYYYSKIQLILYTKFKPLANWAAAYFMATSIILYGLNEKTLIFWYHW